MERPCHHAGARVGGRSGAQSTVRRAPAPPGLVQRRAQPGDTLEPHEEITGLGSGSRKAGACRARRPWASWPVACKESWFRSRGGSRTVRRGYGGVPRGRDGTHVFSDSPSDAASPESRACCLPQMVTVVWGCGRLVQNQSPDGISGRRHGDRQGTRPGLCCLQEPLTPGGGYKCGAQEVGRGPGPTAGRAGGKHA